MLGFGGRVDLVNFMLDELIVATLTEVQTVDPFSVSDKRVLRTPTWGFCERSFDMQQTQKRSWRELEMNLNVLSGFEQHQHLADAFPAWHICTLLGWAVKS